MCQNTTEGQDKKGLYMAFFSPSLPPASFPTVYIEVI